MRFQVLLSLWSVISCLFIDNIPEVTKTNISKPNRYSLSKLRLVHAPLKRFIQSRPHVSTSRCGEICKTPPTAVVLLLPLLPCPGDAVFCCESKTSLFGLPKEDTTRNQWLSCMHNTVPEQYNPNIRVCVAQFTEDCFLKLAGE